MSKYPILENLSIQSGMSLSEIIRIGRNAPLRYKVFEIAKRSGGMRKIAQPSAPLKHLQRALIPILSQYMPLASSAMAYREGVSLRENAKAHRKSRYFIKMDFKNFFNSLVPVDFYKAIGWTGERTGEQRLVTHLIFWLDKERMCHCLSVGAPSSPFISNAIMYHIDESIRRDIPGEVSYTRYADDITISCDDRDILFNAEKIIQTIIRRFSSPSLSFNETKRGFYHPGVRRMVTGLIVTPDGKISLGRERKRLIRAMVHNFRNGQLAPDESRQLQGWLAFAGDCEPELLASLKRKYAAEIEQVLALGRIDRAKRIRNSTEGEP